MSEVLQVQSCNQISPENCVMNSNLTNTDCCIVGGGPAGVILALLLARQGVSVVLLEAHKNFDRDWRGDTIHPLTLELMDELDRFRCPCWVNNMLNSLLI